MKFVDKTFKTEDVNLDFNEFINCTIQDCTLIFHGNPYSFTNTRLEGVRFMFGGAASQTLLFLKFLRETTPQAVEDLINNAGNASPAPGTKAN